VIDVPPIHPRPPTSHTRSETRFRAGSQTSWAILINHWDCSSTTIKEEIVERATEEAGEIGGGRVGEGRSSFKGVVRDIFVFWWPRVTNRHGYTAQGGEVVGNGHRRVFWRWTMLGADLP